MLQSAGIDVAFLYDSSGGHGKTTPVWLPPKGKYCGYAGGLTPENLEVEIPKIAAVVGNHPIYLDMESGVRDSDDHFDLSRAELILKIAKEWVFNDKEKTNVQSRTVNLNIKSKTIKSPSSNTLAVVAG